MILLDLIKYVEIYGESENEIRKGSAVLFIKSTKQQKNLKREKNYII